jgi:hypothetical protein
LAAWPIVVDCVQLYEHKQWGATVRLLLDSFFDDEDGLRSNRATAGYLHTLAQAEGLDLEVRLGNPTGGGIHAKLYLVRVGGKRGPQSAASTAAKSATSSSARWSCWWMRPPSTHAWPRCLRGIGH